MIQYVIKVSKQVYHKPCYIAKEHVEIPHKWGLKSREEAKYVMSLATTT